MQYAGLNIPLSDSSDRKTMWPDTSVGRAADRKSACRWFDSNVQGCSGVAQATNGRERPPLGAIF